MGVSVDEAVWPTASVTRYVTGVLDPAVALASATKVATPVTRFTVQVPSPVIEKVALHCESAGSTRQGPFGVPVCSPEPDASAPAPVTRLENVAV